MRGWKIGISHNCEQALGLLRRCCLLLTTKVVDGHHLGVLIGSCCPKEISRVHLMCHFEIAFKCKKLSIWSPRQLLS